MCDTSPPQQPPRLRQNQDTLPTSKCKECAGRINKGAPRATCRQCTKHFHYKCTSSTRSGQEHAHKEDWNSDACKAAKKPTTIPDIEGETIKTYKAQNQLKILQWNCNSLHGKASELEHFMLKNKIDIACLQETKLTPSDKPITFAGFTVVSKPRTRERVSRGGGVMTLLREGIHFEDAPCAHPDRHSGMEGVSIKATTAENPLTISNLYYPPASSSSVSSYSSANALSIIPNENELVVGDLNAHHKLWDSRLTDDRGNSLADSILVNSAAVLNNGDATRRSPATGTETSPDVTICHRSLADKATWEVIEELNSDHHPIITTVYSTVECREKGSKRAVWDQKRGDWDAFRRAVEEAIPNLPRDNPQRMEKALRTCICKAAYEHIGLKKVSNKTPMWMTTEIEEAIKQRDEAKQNRYNDESRYKEADRRSNI